MKALVSQDPSEGPKLDNHSGAEFLGSITEHRARSKPQTNKNTSGAGEGVSEKPLSILAPFTLNSWQVF